MATTNPKGTEADLRGFLEAAGKSLSEAQGTLTGDSSLSAGGLAISEAQLEVKAAVTQGAEGKLSLQTLSLETLRSGIEPALVSTVNIRYVAVADTQGSAATRPTRAKSEIADLVAKRADIVSLTKIIGPLDIDPMFVPERQRWIVVARDSEGRVLRELIVPDDPKAERRS